MRRPAADCLTKWVMPSVDAWARWALPKAAVTWVWRAVGAAEGVVDVDVAEVGELFGERGVVGLFFRVEAEILQEEGLTGLEVAGQLGGDGADTVRGKGDVLVLVDDVVEEHAEGV